MKRFIYNNELLFIRALHRWIYEQLISSITASSYQVVAAYIRYIYDCR